MTSISLFFPLLLFASSSSSSTLSLSLSLSLSSKRKVRNEPCEDPRHAMTSSNLPRRIIKVMDILSLVIHFLSLVSSLKSFPFLFFWLRSDRSAGNSKIAERTRWAQSFPFFFFFFPSFDMNLVWVFPFPFPFCLWLRWSFCFLFPLNLNVISSFIRFQMVFCFSLLCFRSPAMFFCFPVLRILSFWGDLMKYFTFNLLFYEAVLCVCLFFYPCFTLLSSNTLSCLYVLFSLFQIFLSLVISYLLPDLVCVFLFSVLSPALFSLIFLFIPWSPVFFLFSLLFSEFFCL